MWSFIDEIGTFEIQQFDQATSPYFPLANEAGYLGCITPDGGGDAKTDQNHFLMPPISSVDLHNTRLVRTLWLDIAEYGPWSVTGASHQQKASAAPEDGAEDHAVTGGLLWHKISRRHRQLPLQVEMTTFVPVRDVTCEVTRVTIRNLGRENVTFTPTLAIPLYGRSADSIRDHRHVTSLLHRAWVEEIGVFLRPTMSFDERGHKPNTTVYAVTAVEEHGGLPVGAFPDLDRYIGERGDAEAPRAIYDAAYAERVLSEPGRLVEGCEAIGALRFPSLSLEPDQEHSYIAMAGIFPNADEARSAHKLFTSPGAFQREHRENVGFWNEKLDSVRCNTADSRFDLWMRWVSVQPILRRLYGCSFLPHHDYGRGGRGWRDLWQDCLALLLMEPQRVRHMLLSNFAGVRFDGTNATIIGTEPGEFIADRNNITRVWMDHGAWPLLATLLYVDQTGDVELLLEEQYYFSDRQWARAQEKLDDPASSGTILHTHRGTPYSGSVLEHLLLQHLSAFFHVGENNCIRLEGADWNDALDMAPDRGESVAFTGLYAANLRRLGEIVGRLAERSSRPILIAEEILQLLDRCGGDPLDYDDPDRKRRRLQEFFDNCRHGPSGERVAVRPEALQEDLRQKSEWTERHIRHNEWVETSAGYGWFNGYYDNTGSRVEGRFPSGNRMTLTGQVFQVMSGIATDEQLDRILHSAQDHLWDPSVGGYRLNTDFREVKMDLGRCFGFAYGHKENGAMFSHMAVMFAYALYRRYRPHEAWRILRTIYSAASNSTTSGMYPGIPEYFDPNGRGLYCYLTGSASWYLLTVITEMFGVRGECGDLILAPQLVAEQFSADKPAVIRTYFRNDPLVVEYHNPERLDAGEYQVHTVLVNGSQISLEHPAQKTTIPARLIPGGECHVAAHLGPRVANHGLNAADES